jgi:hypothetical protein
VGDFLTDYILAHSTAHFLHASAHFLQQSCVECFPHSAAQALQTSAQSLHSASQNDESLAANLAHKAQMSAQSRHSAIHFKWSLLFMLMQQVAQSSHSIAHARQASMQFLDFFILFNTFFIVFFSSAVARPSDSLLHDLSFYVVHLLPFIIPRVIGPPPKSRKSTTTTNAMTRGVLVFVLIRLFSFVIPTEHKN